MEFDICVKTDKSVQCKRAVASGVSAMNGQYISIFRNLTTFPGSLEGLASHCKAKTTFAFISLLLMLKKALDNSKMVK